MIKKLLPVLLSAVMLLSIVPAIAVSAETETAVTETGELTENTETVSETEDTASSEISETESESSLLDGEESSSSGSEDAGESSETDQVESSEEEEEEAEEKEEEDTTTVVEKTDDTGYYDPGSQFKPETKAFALINLDTDTMVYGKNANKKMYPASTTKIMTYIIVVEHIEDLENTTITVSKKALATLEGTGSSLAGIYEGEKLTALQLLNLMMVPSGNDAAAVLADYVGDGDEEAFVEMMNAKAEELGCTGTHFANSHGLHDKNHYTTAIDMTKIATYAMTLPHFSEICGQTSYELPPTNKSEESRTVITTNKMLLASEPDYYYQYATGIKTGTTDEAGYCLVSSAVYNGSSYLCVAYGAPSVDKEGNAVEPRMDMVDSANLYRWAFTKLNLKIISNKGTPVAETKLRYVWGKDTILLSPENDLFAVLPVDVNTTSLIVETNDVNNPGSPLPEQLDAPLHAGDVVGTATYSYAGIELGTVNLIVTEDVDRNEFLVVLDVIWSIISSPIFLLCLAAFIVLVILYIILMVRYNRKKRAMKQKHKHYK